MVPDTVAPRHLKILAGPTILLIVMGDRRRGLRWLGQGALSVGALVLLLGFGPCADPLEGPGGGGNVGVDVGWGIVRNGGPATCQEVGAALVRVSVWTMDGLFVDGRDFYCDLGRADLFNNSFDDAKYHVRAELLAGDGSRLAGPRELDVDVTFEIEARADFVFDLGGTGVADAGVGQPDAGPVYGCVYGPPEYVNVVSAVATVDGTRLTLDPTCVIGEVRQAIGWEDHYYPAYIAVGQLTDSRYNQMFLELNFDQAHATGSCDHREVEFGMEGSGYLRFETTEIPDPYGVAYLESQLGGSIAVGEYSDQVGGRISGTFDCPIGSPGGPTRGSITGTFDVGLE
jgi:hypothetical protein